MLKKRIIPCLDIQNGRTVKGVNFESIRDAGDPIELAQKYIKDGADELVFLDITATIEKRKTLTELVKRIAREIDIPFTVGGGINSLDDVSAIINAGADKISINSSAVKRPEFISEVANRYGSQCTVVAIDTKKINGEYFVFVKGGRENTGILALDWALQSKRLGAGEILLTSMNKDGTKSGFDLEITDAVAKATELPVIASGGAGTKEHFSNLFLSTSATGGLAASIFHYNEIPIPSLKNFLRNKNIPIR